MESAVGVRTYTVKDLVLITGSRGFLGRHAVDAFLTAGWEAVGIDSRPSVPGQDDRCPTFTADLRDAGELSSIIKHHRPSVCVHLAAPADVPASFTDPVSDFTGHALPLLSLLDSIRAAASAARVLLVSSAAVYGNPCRLPVRESDPTVPISPYGYHKLMQERLLDEYQRAFGVPGCAARVFSTFGAYQRRLAVWEITKRALRGEHIVLGTGAESRDYLSAVDVGRALHCIAERGEFDGAPINVASGEEMTIAEIASAIYRLLDIAESPLFTGIGSVGSPIRWRADVSRLAGLNFNREGTIEHDLAATVKWIRDNA